MKQIINEWRVFLKEQDPAKAPTPGEKLLKKVKDVPSFEDVEKKVRDRVQQIPAGFMHPGQPNVTRTSIQQGTSSDNVKYGPAPMDKVLAWSVKHLKDHAEILGIIPDNSRYFMPAGRNSGLRSDKVQKEKFINKFNFLNQELQKGAETVSRGSRTITRKDNKFFLNGKPVKNLAWAIHMVARQEIARPYQSLDLIAFDKSKYKTKPGDPKHLTGRTIDFVLQGDEGRLDMDLNDKAHQSKTSQFLKKYGPMYGLINYGSESWHWEMNAENRAFFAKMMSDQISPVKSALNALVTKGLLKEPVAE